MKKGYQIIIAYKHIRNIVQLNQRTILELNKLDALGIKIDNCILEKSGKVSFRHDDIEIIKMLAWKPFSNFIAKKFSKKYNLKYEEF